MSRKSAALLLPLVVFACANLETPPPAPMVTVPDKLNPGPNETLMLIVPAKGVQIYECRPKKDQANVFEWAFVAPEAELFDAAWNKIGKHYAGPHWEAADGSKVLGALKERVDAPSATAIPWLLLTTKSVGPAGRFSKVTSIQRLNTVGGVAPKEGCSRTTVKKTVNVNYTADYYLFTGK
jgi:hypothetical protein